jgi:heme/copper-type cytochrome/quinol oxidase subunit 2
MRGWIYVHTPEDYQKWAAENLTAEAKPAEATPAAEPAKPAETKTGGKAKK